MILPRLYPILDTALYAQRRFSVVEAARLLVESGVHLMQWRCKTAVGPAQLAELEQLQQLCHRSGATLVVNDRADLALMTGARGVHVGQDDLHPTAVRQLTGPQALLGYSTHNREQFLNAARLPVDYLALGPIYGTANKENPDPVVGLETLQLCSGLTRLPVVAIGGITRARAPEVFAAGAASVAVIGDLAPEVCDAETFRQRLNEWLRIL